MSGEELSLIFLVGDFMNNRLLIIFLTITIILSVTGCFHKDNNNTSDDENIDMDNKQRSIKAYSIHFKSTIENDIDSDEYIIIPTMQDRNESNLIIDMNSEYINFENNDLYQYKIEITKYGYGVNITPIPQKKIELGFVFNNNIEVNITSKYKKDHFLNDGPGISFWIDKNDKIYTLIYSSVEIYGQFNFHFNRYTTVFNLRDYSYVYHLDRGWNELEITRNISNYYED